MSDMVLALNITPLPGTTPTTREAFEIVPNPTGYFEAASPLRIFFEIYNLSYNADDATSYTVAIQLNALKRKVLGGKPRPSLSIEVPQSSSSIHTIEFPEVDISSVSPGRYELIVIVKDTVSGETAQRSRVVELL